MLNESSVNSAKRLPVAMKADFGGVFLSLIADVRHAKFERGEEVPLAVRVSYDKDKKYFRTGMKMSSLKAYLSFVSAYDSRPDRKEQLDYFNMILDVVKNIIISSKGRFSLERLQEEVAKGFKPMDNDTFTYWKNISKGKEKVKTRQMYDMALKRFREFRNGSPIQLPDVTTDLIGKFDKWLMKQKSGVVRKGEKPNKPLSLDTRMMILRALRAVLNQAKKDGLIDVVPEFKDFMHTGNRRRTNAISVEDVLKLWDYWTSLDSRGKQSAKGRAVGRWLMLYSLNGLNAIDMAKLVWQDNSSADEDYPQLSFIRSKIDRANKPVGKQLDVTIIPIIPQLRQLLNEYASPFKVGAPVFPDIFGNAVTDEAKVIRVHDFNRRISKNIAEVCDTLDIQRITPQYARNSFISALAHHGVMASYIDYAVGHTTSEVSALLAGYINNLSDEAMQAYNEKIFIIPPIPQN